MRRALGSEFSLLALLAIFADAGLPSSSARAQVLIAPAIQSVSSELSYCCDRKAAYLVDGSALTAGASGIIGDSDSTHGSAPDHNMWVSDTGDTSPILVFNLGGAYNLQTTRIWNYNETCCTAFGARNVEIAVSLDNVSWTVLATNTFAQAGGGPAEPSQNFSTPAANVRFVRLRLMNNYGGALFGLSEARFVVQPNTTNGGLTLFTNATTVELANSVQKLTFIKGGDGKFHITTSVWDGSTWRSFFDAQHPLIEGSAFNLEPTSYSVLTDSDSKKSVRFQGTRSSPTYAFDITVDMESGSDLAKFAIINHLSSGLTLSGQQPTVGLWMNRASAQYVMHQGPPSATRVAFPPDFNCGSSRSVPLGPATGGGHLF